MSAGQWWVMTLGVGLLAGFLAVLVMLPSTEEHRTGVRQDWPDRVAMNEFVRVRVAFVTTKPVPGPNVVFELASDSMVGVEFDTAKPYATETRLPDGSIRLTVPSDPGAGRGEYKTELLFKAKDLGQYQIHVRYQIGHGVVNEFVASGQVVPSRASISQEPVHAWE